MGGAGIVASDLKVALEKLGIPVEILETYKFRSYVYQLKKVLQKSNIVNLTSSNVILNTVDHAPGVMKSVFSQLKDNPGMKLIWYIHEDQPQIWLNQVDTRWLIASLNDVKSQILIGTPSKGTLSNLLDYFDGFKGGIDTLMYPVPIPSNLLLNENDNNNFTNLKFYISGTTHDSRKNHRIAIKIFSQVKEIKRDGFRDFELVFIGVGKDSYSSETNQMGIDLLGERYVSFPKCNRDEALAYLNKCHIAICISEFEALPRYVSEGLFFGHPVLRNECSGLEEQMNLWEHRNGWIVDQENEKEFIQIILEILNPDITSDQELREMRKNSKHKANRLNEDFENSLQKIVKFFQGTKS